MVAKPFRLPCIAVGALAVLQGAAPPAFAQSSGAQAYSLPNSAPRDSLRDLSTDRPDKTESPYTVDAGHIQIELDFVTYTRDRSAGGDRLSETLGVLPINLKLGLTGSTDIQLLVDPYLRQTVTDRTSNRRDRIEGFGDVTLRLKHNLWGNDGGDTVLALMPFVTFPTSSNGVGTDRAEFGLIVPFSIGLTERIGIGVMTEVDFRASDGDDYRPTFINSATVGFDFSEQVGMYAELFTERGSERGARWIVTGDIGVTYAVTDNIQLDAGVNIGITDAADDLELFLGFSRRF